MKEPTFEIEAKMFGRPTDVSAGYEALLQWLGRQGVRGTSPIKDQVDVEYFDASAGQLFTAGAAFRSRHGGRSFRLKYNFGSIGVMAISKEVTWKGLFRPLDFTNPFHRFSPMARHLQMIIDRSSPGVAWKEDFAPRIKLDCERRYHVLVSGSHGDRLVGLSLDKVLACRPSAGSSAVSWQEIEIESIGNTPRSLEMADEIIAFLRHAGLSVNTTGKYQRARAMLWGNDDAR